MSGRDEAGVTLIELLIAIVITGAIALAMAGAIIIGFRSTTTSDARLSENRDVQLVQGIFPQDIMGAETVATGGSGNPNCTGQTALLVLKWKTPTLVPSNVPGPPVTTSKQYQVTYSYSVLPPVPAAPAKAQIIRRLYEDADCTLVSTRPLASSVSATVTPVVSIDAAAQTVTLTVTDSSGNKYVARAKERS